MKPKLPSKNLVSTTIALCCIANSASLSAATLDLSNVPLAISSAVDPNIMFLVDSSGSMRNIVPDSPYDKNTTYATCASTLQMPTTDQIDIRVSDSGDPYFEQAGVEYDWGTAAGTGTHGDRKCFDPAANYPARLYASEDETGYVRASGYLASEYTGNYLNWYFGTSPTNWGSGARSKPGTQRRIDIARDGGKLLFDSLSDVRVGLATYDDDKGATIEAGVKDLDATHKTNLKTMLDGITPSGSTPLAEALQEIGRYFVEGHNNDLTLHPGHATDEKTKKAHDVFDKTPNYASGVTQASPIQYFCQKNFTVLLTDGRPTDDHEDVNGELKDYDGDCAGGGCDSHDKKPGRTYESDGSDYLDDVALALNEIDLRPDLDDYDGNEVVNNIATYPIGFADDQVINDPLMLDTAANGNAAGLYLTAENSGQLVSALNSAISDIQDRVGSSASVALNSGSLAGGSHVYQTRFNSGNWTGELLAFPLDADGEVATTATWEAQDELDTQDFDTGRAILTYDPINPSGAQGIPFRWGDLNATQTGQLNTAPDGSTDTEGADRLDYLRGSNANEGAGNNYRPRASKLGDLVNSTPFYVGAPAFRYPDTMEADPYSSFYAAYKNRIPMLYAGANDGMLHGFDARDSATGGQERIAYVPNRLFADLSKLTTANYEHRYYVDGSPTAGDAFGAFGARCTSSPCWRTVLAGGLRGGGQGIFALDVTDPGADFSEANAAQVVLWEFTDSDDADLGYTYSQPAIVKMANGVWAAVFGNGYNNTVADGAPSTSGDAVLYVVDIATGSLIKKISTEMGTAEDPEGNNRPNGLATTAPVDVDGDHQVDFVYAGDLFGNLWKFDLRDATDPNQWKVAYGTVASPQPLFTAVGPGGTRQPITTRPQVDLHPTEDGYLVLFGTGKYIELADNASSGQETQTFYGIWDKNGATLTAFTRDHLLAQEIFIETTVGNYGLRLVSDNTIAWHTTSGNPSGNPATTHLGWYLDLYNTESSNTDNFGERQVTNPLLRNGRIIFTTLIPDPRVCGSGGASWLMELDAYAGSRLEYPPFDLNGDELFTDQYDMLTVTIDGEEIRLAPSGIQSTEGSLAGAAVLALDEKEKKYGSGSSGGIFTITENPGPISTGRQTWRQLYQ